MITHVKPRYKVFERTARAMSTIPSDRYFFVAEREPSGGVHCTHGPLFTLRTAALRYMIENGIAGTCEVVEI